MFTKRPEQVYLNTWHGTPLMTLGKAKKADFAMMGNEQKTFFDADYIVCPNEYTMEHMIEDYMLENFCQAEILLAGFGVSPSELSGAKTFSELVDVFKGDTEKSPDVETETVFEGEPDELIDMDALEQEVMSELDIDPDTARENDLDQDALKDAETEKDQDPEKDVEKDSESVGFLE